MESKEIWDLYNEKRELTGRDQVPGLTIDISAPEI